MWKWFWSCKQCVALLYGNNRILWKYFSHVESIISKIQRNSAVISIITATNSIVLWQAMFTYSSPQYFSLNQFWFCSSQPLKPCMQSHVSHYKNFANSRVILPVVAGANTSVDTIADKVFPINPGAWLRWPFTLATPPFAGDAVKCFLECSVYSLTTASAFIRFKGVCVSSVK